MVYQSDSFSQYIVATIKQALAEDLGQPPVDLTANLIPEEQQATAELITREAAVICGRQWFEQTFKLLDPSVSLHWSCEDGDHAAANQTLVTIEGPARAILTGERTAMNFLQTLSGTASMTHQYAEQIKGTQCRLLDTRKTLPGLRLAQKYAVSVGGGENHRIGLYDAYLIKENHIATCGSIERAVALAKQSTPGIKIQVEVETFNELEQAFAAGVDVIMLDNFNLDDMAEAVKRNQALAHPTKLEASGDVTIKTIRAVAQTGVDYISVGALTKHITATDLSLRVSI